MAKRKKKSNFFNVIVILLLVLFIGFFYNNPTIIYNVTGKQPEPIATPSVIPSITTSPSNSKITVGAFNLQVFGTTKASNLEVMEVLSKVIRNYDVIAVQEIRDASQTALPSLINAVNSMGSPQYDYVVSERLGRTSSKEQYAYIFNTQTIQLIGSAYTYPDSSDIFQREPYISEFKAKNGNFDFVLLVIHVDPDTATQEINDLPKAVEDAKSRYQGEGDFIVMGDLNADCSYFNESSQSPLRSSDYYWVINNSIDTTTKSTKCTYDRIIITTSARDDFTGDSGVFTIPSINRWIDSPDFPIPFQ